MVAIESWTVVGDKEPTDVVVTDDIDTTVDVGGDSGTRPGRGTGSISGERC